ncbi:MAG: hypothetical protein VX201_14985, partial [Pseudomonadota bacterium]|nr:hypothetical protein [Pseudomonadota bacterium]
VRSRKSILELGMVLPNVSQGFFRENCSAGRDLCNIWLLGLLIFKLFLVIFDAVLKMCSRIGFLLTL